MVTRRMPAESKDSTWITAKCELADGSASGYMRPMQIPTGLPVEIIRLGLATLAEAEAAAEGREIHVNITMVFDLENCRVLYRQDDPHAN
jgi:hypothetical protein